ncbi:MAG: hypothetical protein MUD12_03815 [Spirochaetes bacterium]|jgi:hypothetical protein|nr:hypothetical protein [Spirochaetota bacterium]
MKRFILKFLIFIAMIISYLVGVIYLSPIDQDIFIAASIEKHKLLEKTEQPRIIFIGGSGLAFGFDSGMVRDATGYNVVNMGLHGGLGPQFYVNEVKPYLRDGDILVFMLEYIFYDGLFFGGRTTLVELSIFYPRSLLYYSKENIDCYFENLPITFQRRLRGIFTKSKKRNEYNYRRSGFDEHGDYTAHLALKPRLDKMGQYVPRKVSGKVEILMNDLSEFCKKKNVRLYLAFPTMNPPSGNPEKQFRDDLGSLYSDIKDKIKIEMIGSPYDFLYPEEYYFDTVYHLNAAGREKRTRDLIEQMKKTSMKFLK